jgi:hypothetical protein
VDKPAKCLTDVDLGRQLSGRYVARRAAERGYELPLRNADCHLPRSRWVHVGKRGQSDSWRRAAHSTNLTDLTYLAVQRGATQPKTLAYVIDVNFEVEKQIGVPYRHAQIVG